MMHIKYRFPSVPSAAILGDIKKCLNKKEMNSGLYVFSGSKCLVLKIPEENIIQKGFGKTEN